MGVQVDRPGTGLEQARKDNPWLMVWLPASIIFALLIVNILLAAMIDSRSHSSVTEWFVPLASVITLCLAIPMLIYLRSWYRVTRHTPAREFADSRFQFFKSNLETVAIGLGHAPPDLVVVEDASPNAYIVDPRKLRNVIAVSKPLLALDLTDQQVEAIMAAMLARIVVSESSTGKPDLPEMRELLPETYSRMLESTWRAGEVLYGDWILRCDGLASKVTGNPLALSQAIDKVHKGVMRMREGVNLLSAYLAFVEPPTDEKRFDRTAGFSDLLVQIRIENLEHIRTGGRAPFSSVRNGRSVVQPEGWR